MTDAATIPAEAAAPLDPDAEWVGRHVRVLEELAGIGMELARELRDHVRAPAYAKPKEIDPEVVAEVFNKIARAVRLTLALEGKVRTDHAARLRDPERQDAMRRARWAAEARARPRAERRRVVLVGVVSDMIGAQAEWDVRCDETELREDYETLIERDLCDEDVLNRPMPELIGAICKALNIEPDWSLWDPAEWTDHGLTESELAAGSPTPKPRRVLFPEQDDETTDPEAAEDEAERLAVCGPAAIRSPP